MLRFIVGGLVLSLGCGSSTVLQCRVDAVSRLPLAVVENPDALSLGDVKQLARELKACRQVEPDGGAS